MAGCLLRVLSTDNCYFDGSIRRGTQREAKVVFTSKISAGRTGRQVNGGFVSIHAITRHQVNTVIACMLRRIIPPLSPRTAGRYVRCDSSLTHTHKLQTLDGCPWIFDLRGLKYKQASIIQICLTWTAL
jgi:hypothetical protein